MEDVAAEVHRITECLYLPSLKRLHDVLENIDSRLLQQWARGNACQMDALARVVLGGLELWPYTLNILEILSRIPSFQNAILRQQPTLLDTILKNATKSESGFQKFAGPCVSVLSTPLKVAVPSTIPLFLLQLLNRAVRHLSAETIRPVYQAISGLGSVYLDDLPLDLLHCFQDQLLKPLKALDINHHSATVLCLAVLARIVFLPSCSPRRQRLRALPTEKQHLPEQTSRSISALQFFTGEKGYKTLDLVVLKVVQLCSQSSILEPSEATESLKHLEEIVDVIDDSIKKSWVMKNSAKIERIYDKMSRQNIERSVQCATLNFLVSLNVGPLPEGIYKALDASVVSSNPVALSPRAVAAYIARAEGPYLCDKLLNVLRLSSGVDSATGVSLAELASALTFVHALAESSSQSLQQGIVSLLSTDDSKELLHRFASQGPLQPSLNSNDKYNICPFIQSETLTRLHQRLSILLLSSALRQPHDLSLMRTLLEKQTKLPNIREDHRCCNPVSVAESACLIEAGSTPQIKSVSHEWRKNLMLEMSRDTTYRYDSVSRMVGEICRDLEVRCDEAERPLRDEQSKSSELQSKLEFSMARVSELETQAQNRTAVLSGLETDRGQLLDQIKSSEQRLQSLSATHNQIRQRFETAEIECRKAADAATESARQQELVYIATLTGKDEMFEEQTLQLASYETHANALGEELARMRLCEAQMVKAHESKVLELTNTLVASHEKSESDQAEIFQLSESQTRLKAVHEELITKEQENLTKHESLVFVLSKQISLATTEASRLRSEHEAFAAAKAAEIKSLELSNKEISSSLRAELAEVHESAELASKQSKASIAHLQRRVTKLQQEREKQVREFAEAQDLSNKLTALMSLTKNQTVSSTSRTRSFTASREHHDSSDDGIPKRRPSIGFCSKSSTLSTSSKTNGRTPKRTKVHQTSRSLRGFSIEAMRVATAEKTYRRNTLKANRVSLAELRKTQSQGFLTPTQPSRKQTYQVGVEMQDISRRTDSDEESFGGGELFASTDQQALATIRAESYDDRTMDF